MVEEFLGSLNPDKITAVGTLVIVAVAIITDKLVWHKRFENEQKRADRWETIALEALTAGAQAGVKAAEVTVGVISALPDPQRDRSDGKV